MEPPTVNRYNLARMDNGVPTANETLYEENPLYRQAWDKTLASHRQQFGKDYVESSDKDQIIKSVMARMAELRGGA